MDNENASWATIKSKILHRQQPFSTLHWRFLWPACKTNIRLHRHVLLNCYARFPAWLKVPAFAYVYLRWWCYLSWLAIYKTHKKESHNYYQRYRISKIQQFASLCKLSFFYCIPPQEYYAMRLHRWPSKEWLTFIYDFQAQSWHNAFSGDTRSVKKTQSLLTDKLALERHLIKHGLGTVKTLKKIVQTTQLEQTDLDYFPNQLFFKPVTGNQSKGCFFYEKIADKNIELTHFKTRVKLSNVSLETLNKHLSNSDYLAQEVIKNHPDFTTLFQVSETVVIRIVTIASNNDISTAFAFAEIPSKEQQGLYWNISLNLDSAEFEYPAPGMVDETRLASFFDMIDGRTCPHLKAMIALCQQAHALLSSLPSIAWDVALSPKGVMIIEGNCSWGAGHVQAISGAPALQGVLGDFYLKLMTK